MININVDLLVFHVSFSLLAVSQSENFGNSMFIRYFVLQSQKKHHGPTATGWRSYRDKKGIKEGDQKFGNLRKLKKSYCLLVSKMQSDAESKTQNILNLLLLK